MKQASRLVAVGSVVALCLMIAACTATGGTVSTEGDNSSTSSSTSSMMETSTTRGELTPVSWRTGFGCDSWDTPYYVAKELGFYEEAGLDVTIGCGEGSNSNVQLIASKAETFGHVASSAVAAAVAEGANVRMVASFLQSAGDGILAKPEIETVDQMAGKTYAGSSFSYVTTLMPIFEQAAGLEPGSINMQITSGGQMQLFIAGEADMIPGQGWAEVPNFTAQGIDFNFFPMAEYGLDLIGPGITTNADTLAEDPEMVASFVAASQRGSQYTYDNPEEATQIISTILPDIDPVVHRAVIDSLEQHSASSSDRRQESRLAGRE